MARLRICLFSLGAFAACSADPSGVTPGPAAPDLASPDLHALPELPMTPPRPPPAQDDTRDILDTNLMVDLATDEATARLRIAPSNTSTGASFEVEGLSVLRVRDQAGPLDYRVSMDGRRLDVGVPTGAGEVIVDYRFSVHNNFDGLLPEGVTFVWPYFCGDLFPCHSAPADGTTFSLALSNVPAGKTAVYPPIIPSNAPSYMIAWAVGDYSYLKLGTTGAGREVGVWYTGARIATARKGARSLVAAFDWYESTLGPYSFGTKVASVEAKWGPGAYGGMEHHPYWHVASDALGDPETHVHEAAHGWFGDGVRIKCWEDFTLSEGTVSYLSARALEATGDAAAQTIWSSFQTRLDDEMKTNDSKIAWPDSCGKVDVLATLYTDIPYMKGAFFWKALEGKIGRARLDAALGHFYQLHHGEAAGMQDALDLVKADTGYDATACAAAWLRQAPVPMQTVCP